MHQTDGISSFSGGLADSVPYADTAAYILIWVQIWIRWNLLLYQLIGRRIKAMTYNWIWQNYHWNQQCHEMGSGGADVSWRGGKPPVELYFRERRNNAF